jgi:hypothetical protein
MPVSQRASSSEQNQGGEPPVVAVPVVAPVVPVAAVVVNATNFICAKLPAVSEATK